jgi:hypothetical protein
MSWRGIWDNLNEWDDTRYYTRDTGGCSPASVTSHVMGGFAGTFVGVFFGAEYTTGVRIGYLRGDLGISRWK